MAVGLTAGLAAALLLAAFAGFAGFTAFELALTGLAGAFPFTGRELDFPCAGFPLLLTAVLAFAGDFAFTEGLLLAAPLVGEFPFFVDTFLLP
ncbi:MAG: hypothetical protein OEW39_12635 [Deltaproteobacteria bacterium]|nr:hypothetical protein [Deltaproteobacteria bacterium]